MSKQYKNVPLKLSGDFPPEFDIRGEIILPLAGFEALNEKRLAAGEEPYRNPRNTASGSLKLQDSSETARRPLECFFYALSGDLNYTTHWESLIQSPKLGIYCSQEHGAAVYPRGNAGLYQSLGGTASQPSF